MNMDSFRNVVLFAPISARKGAFSGIPCSFPNHSFHSVRIRHTLLPPLGYKATLSALFWTPFRDSPLSRFLRKDCLFGANPQIWKIFVKNPRFFVNTKDTSIFTIFMKITRFPCDWMILEDRFEHFPDTPSSKFS